MKDRLNFLTINTNNIEAIVSREEMQLAAFSKRYNAKDFVLISIQGVEDKVKLKSSHKKFKKSIHLLFEDITEPQFDRGKWFYPINQEQAKELVSFIMENKGEKFFIHCEAGQSRSAGIGLALDCILEHDGNLNNFNRTAHPIFSLWRYNPNFVVMNAIISAYNEAKTEFNELVCPHCSCSIDKTVKGLKDGIEIEVCPFCYESI